MSLLVATQITAIATTVLAVGAIATAVFALLAFRKQSAEVRILGQQLEDQQALTRHEAELLKVQSRQLELQSWQFEEQSKVNVAQAEVLALQAKDLEESLAERQRDREQRRQAQAVRVFISQDLRPPDSRATYLEAMRKVARSRCRLSPPRFTTRATSRSTMWNSSGAAAPHRGVSRTPNRCR